MSIRHKSTTVIFKLEAESFEALQPLMLKNNLKNHKFFSYEIRTPQFEGDTYKAFYYSDALKS